MKKVFYLLMSVVMFAFASCTSCKHDPVEPVFNGYDFDEVVINDYDYIASQHEHFAFREAEARFDSVLSMSNDNTINYVGTTFQCDEIVNMIFHTPDTARLNGFIKFAESIETWKQWTIDTNDVDYRMHLQFKDVVIECGELNARNPITFDSCMKIVEPYREQLHTRALTLRRFIDPRLPENPQYIFGTGVVIVDVITGEVGDLNGIEFKTFNGIVD